jgi:hypothetical protein
MITHKPYDYGTAEGTEPIFLLPATREHIKPFNPERNLRRFRSSKKTSELGGRGSHEHYLDVQARRIIRRLPSRNQSGVTK